MDKKTKALFGFIVWYGATIWLFYIDWKIALCVSLITLSIRRELKYYVK